MDSTGYETLIVPNGNDGVLRVRGAGAGAGNTNIRLASSRSASPMPATAPIPRWIWLLAGGIALLAIATKG